MTDSPNRTGIGQRLVADPAELERLRSLREDPQWRPGAMRPEERERLVRIGLHIVLGDRAGRVTVRRSGNDTIVVSDPQQHGFGFPPDPVLGDDPQTVLEHDIEWLIDELCETSVAWAERLPLCPIHPGVHPLSVAVAPARVTASCPVDGVEVRTNSY
ncbi:MAG: hypothetical protein ACTHMH_05095 [Curtobacterium sp.]